MRPGGWASAAYAAANAARAADIERAARAAGRIPTTAHAGQHSVGSHAASGPPLRGVNPTPPNNRGLTTAARERQEILAATDARVGKRNVFHG